jgi:hypothetical protein
MSISTCANSPDLDPHQKSIFEPGGEYKTQHTRTDLFWFYLSCEDKYFIPKAEKLLDDGLTICIKTNQQLKLTRKVNTKAYINSFYLDIKPSDKNPYPALEIPDAYDYFVKNNLFEGRSTTVLRIYIPYFLENAFQFGTMDELDKFMDLFDLRLKSENTCTSQLLERRTDHLDYTLKMIFRCAYTNDISYACAVDLMLPYLLNKYIDISYDYYDEIIATDGEIIISGKSKILDLFSVTKNFLRNECMFECFKPSIYFDLFLYLIEENKFDVNINYYFEKIMLDDKQYPTNKYRTSDSLHSSLVKLESSGCLQHLFDLGLDITYGKIAEILLDLEPLDFCKVGKSESAEQAYIKKIITIYKTYPDFWEEHRTNLSIKLCSEYLIRYVFKFTEASVKEFVALGIDFHAALSLELQKPLSTYPPGEIAQIKHLWMYFLENFPDEPPKGNPAKVFCVCLIAKRKDLALKMVEAGIKLDPFDGFPGKKPPPTSFLTKENYKDFLLDKFVPEIFDYASLFNFHKKELVLTLDFKSKKGCIYKEQLNLSLLKKDKQKRQNLKMVLHSHFVKKLIASIDLDGDTIGRYSLATILIKPDFDERYLELLTPSITKCLDLDFVELSIDYQKLLEYMTEVRLFSPVPLVLVIEHLRKHGAKLELVYDEFRQMLLDNYYAVLGTNDYYFDHVKEWLEFASLKVDDLIEKLYCASELPAFNARMLYANNNLEILDMKETHRSSKLINSIETKSLAAFCFKLEYYSSDPNMSTEYKDTLIEFIEHNLFNINLHIRYIMKSNPALVNLAPNHIYDIMQSLSDQKISIRILFDKMFAAKERDVLCRTVIDYLVEEFGSNLP